MTMQDALRKVNNIEMTGYINNLLSKKQRVQGDALDVLLNNTVVVQDTALNMINENNMNFSANQTASERADIIAAGLENVVQLNRKNTINKVAGMDEGLKFLTAIMTSMRTNPALGQELQKVAQANNVNLGNVELLTNDVNVPPQLTYYQMLATQEMLIAILKVVTTSVADNLGNKALQDIYAGLCLTLHTQRNNPDLARIVEDKVQDDIMVYLNEDTQMRNMLDRCKMNQMHNLNLSTDGVGDIYANNQQLGTGGFFGMNNGMINQQQPMMQQQPVYDQYQQPMQQFQQSQVNTGNMYNTGQQQFDYNQNQQMGGFNNQPINQVPIYDNNYGFNNQPIQPIQQAVAQPLYDTNQYSMFSSIQSTPAPQVQSQLYERQGYDELGRPIVDYIDMNGSIVRREFSQTNLVNNNMNNQMVQMQQQQPMGNQMMNQYQQPMQNYNNQMMSMQPMQQQQVGFYNQGIGQGYGTNDQRMFINETVTPVDENMVAIQKFGAQYSSNINRVNL